MIPCSRAARSAHSEFHGCAVRLLALRGVETEADSLSPHEAAGKDDQCPIAAVEEVRHSVCERLIGHPEVAELGAGSSADAFAGWGPWGATRGKVDIHHPFGSVYGQGDEAYALRAGRGAVGVCARTGGRETLRVSRAVVPHNALEKSKYLYLYLYSPRY